MYNKTYTVSIPTEISKSLSINIVNSMLIKLRYYSEKMQIFSRKGSNHNEKEYRKNLSSFLGIKRDLRKFGVIVNKKWGCIDMEELREKLNKVIEAGYSLTSNLVVSISKELDKPIVKEQLKKC